MEHIVCALELTSSGVKMAVGYTYEKKVYILHSLESIRSKLIYNQIADTSEMVASIRELVKSAQDTLKMDFDSCVLVMPSSNMKVVQKHQTVSTTDMHSEIKVFDGSNLVSMMRKDCRNAFLESNLEVLDIVPISWVDDKNKTYRYFPKGTISSELSLNGDCEMIDKLTFESLTKVVEDAGLSIDKTISGANATVKLISLHSDSPQEFIMVDFGAKTTTFSLCYDHRLLSSFCINYGSEDIDEELMREFKIDKSVAKYYKLTYGLSNDPDFEFKTKEGISLSEISKVIRNSLNRLYTGLEKYISTLDVSTPSSIMLVGGGSSLLGFSEDIKDRFRINVYSYSPLYLGARSRQYLNLVSAIKYYSEYELKTSSKRPSDLTLTRVSSSSDELHIKVKNVSDLGDEKL